MTARGEAGASPYGIGEAGVSPYYYAGANAGLPDQGGPAFALPGDMLLSILRRQLPAAVVVLASLVSGARGTLHAQTTRGSVRKPEITKLTITGVKSVDKDELRQNLAVDESHCVSLLLRPLCLFTKAGAFYHKEYLDHDELARDVLRARVFYFERGFRDTQVDTTVTSAGRGAVHVTVAVHEGQPTIVRSLRVVQTDTVIPPRALGRSLVLKQGEPLSLIALDSTRALLQARLWEHGRADAVIDTTIVVDTAAHTGDVTITIDPRWRAHVATIDVQGNEHVSARTIRKSLAFKPGDLYKRSDVLRSQRTLYESNLFRRASIEVPEADDSLKHVLIIVQEAPLRDARVSAGFNTVDFVQVQGQYTNFNWLGGAKRLSLNATLGNLFARTLNGNGIFYDVGRTVVGGSAAKYFAPTYSASADFRYPWFGSPRNEIALGAFAHRRSAPGIYVDQGYGASATFTRTLTERGPMSLTYRYEVTRTDAGDVYFCVNYGVCDARTLDALRANQHLSPLALTLTLDKTDNPFEPRRGFRTQGTLEHASRITLSDFRYNRVSTEGAMFFPIGRRSAIGAHLRLGYVDALKSTLAAVGVGGVDASGATSDVLHPSKRFYAGGSQSVRGYGEGQLGPRVLTIPASKLLANDSSCTAATITQCNPDAPKFQDRDFTPRPLGGNELVEGSVEFRFPLYGKSFLGATFVDAAFLAQNTNKTLPRSKLAATPGFGVRYLSPVGPIRVDIGINPVTAEKLPVVTEDVASGGTSLVRLASRRTYSPAQGGGGLNDVLNRLTLHLSIGEAF